MKEFNLNDYMSVAEVAAHFGKSEGTIRGWVNRGVLDGIQSGPFDNSATLVSRESVDRLSRQLARGKSKTR